MDPPFFLTLEKEDTIMAILLCHLQELTQGDSLLLDWEEQGVMSGLFHSVV